MRRALLLAGAALLTTLGARAGEWWDTSWNFRQRVALDASLADSAIKNFPLRVRLTDAVFARRFAQNDGADLCAVDADGHPLDLEIVTWADNEVVLQIRIRDLATTAARNGFHLYFGNLRAQPAPAANLWDEPHLAVLHLSGDVRNAALHPARVERVGFVIQNGTTPGLISDRNERWATFNRDYRGCVILTPEAPPANTGFTLAARFRVTGEQRMALFSGSELTVFTEQGRLVFRTGDDELSADGLRTGQWHSAVVSYDHHSGRRVLHLDDRPAVSDRLAVQSLALHSLRIGRALSDDASTQFGGDVESVRVLAAAPNDAWLRAFAVNLGHTSPLVSIGPLEQASGSPPPPPPPQVLAPVDDARSYKPRGIELSWLPSAGATSYQVLLFADAAARQPLATLPADSSCRRPLRRDEAGGTEVYWTIAAVSPHGVTRSESLRKLTFSDRAVSSGRPETPRLQTPANLVLDLRGYLGARVDRLATYMVDFPARNPGLLRMLRERPEPNIPSWAGVFPGQYLSSAQLMWRLTRRDDLAAHLRHYVRDLLATQRDDGYFAPFEDLHGSLSLWSHYAMLVGLLDYHADTGSPETLQAARRIGDLVIRVFGPAGIELPKSGGADETISHAMVLLHQATGDVRYLEFARYVVDEVWNEPGGVAFFRLGRQRAPLAKFPVRRWEGVHNLATLSELYWATGDTDARDAFVHLWRTLRETERHTTGGFSTNEGLLGTPYNRGTIETCCTVAWTLLASDMLRLTGDSSAADELEWSTLNSALGSIPFDGTCATYGTQPDGLRQFLQLRQGPPDGIELNCCSTNAARAIGNIADWALLRDARGLVLNFYGPSTISADLPSGNRIVLTQLTDYPATGFVRLRVDLSESESFPLRLRIPAWSNHTVLRVNDVVQPAPQSGAYAVVDRRWSAGDTVTLDFDFTPRVESGREHYAGQVALFRGPLLLASDARYTNDRKPHASPISLEGLTIEPLTTPPGPGPWVLARVTDGAGRSFTVCDFSSAGLFADPYRSWFDLDSSPAP